MVNETPAEADSGPLTLTTSPVPGVVVVRINRPQQRNALNLAVKNEIADIIERLDEEPEVRVIILTGSVDVFAAGTDVKEMAGLSPTDHVRLRTDRVFTALRGCRTVTIAAVEGFALGGGCELALSCDLVIAAGEACFGQPEICVGVMPGAGATQRMVRTVGKYRTLRLLLTGDRFSASQAHAMGLVSELAENGRALDRALELATTVARLPQLAVRAIVDVVEAGADAPLETALLLERKSFQLMFDTPDQTEGMRAFIEKRIPQYD